MASVKDRIQNQIQRQGLTTENQVLLALFEALIKHGFRGQLMFHEMVRVTWENRNCNYTVKESFIELVKDLSLSFAEIGNKPE